MIYVYDAIRLRNFITSLPFPGSNSGNNIKFAPLTADDEHSSNIQEIHSTFRGHSLDDEEIQDAQPLDDRGKLQ